MLIYVCRVIIYYTPKPKLNIMKKLTYILLITLSALNFNCTTDSTYEDASEFSTDTFAARFVNESAASVDLVVYDLNGSVVSTTNGIRPGGSANVDSTGETTFRIMTELSDRIEVLDIENTNSYYVVLDNENLVSTIQTARL